jgi:hypothetical protein
LKVYHRLHRFVKEQFVLTFSNLGGDRFDTVSIATPRGGKQDNSMDWICLSRGISYEFDIGLIKSMRSLIKDPCARTPSHTPHHPPHTTTPVFVHKNHKTTQKMVVDYASTTTTPATDYSA